MFQGGIPGSSRLSILNDSILFAVSFIVGAARFCAFYSMHRYNVAP
jgi:hypothetical protein